jgi:hypothetical protein
LIDSYQITSKNILRIVNSPTLSMSHSSSCSGCVPVYQNNQLAHCEVGGCLYQQLEHDMNLELDSDVTVLPISPEKISTEDDSVECCICYEMINTKKNNCVTECGHQFCFKCLATSMVHNNCVCPCCRSPLVEGLSEDSDDESQDSDDDDEDVEEDDEDNEIECDIVELTRRLKNSGFKMQDVLSMLVGRYTKGVSDLDIHALNQKFDSIVDDADMELVEQESMALEDINI